MRWATAVTTCPQRRRELLPRTLASLKAAGFPAPRLFVDADRDPDGWESEFGCEVTVRTPPPVRTFGNWVLSLWELLVRNPAAERFGLFQDDFVCVRSLRAYLERTTTQERVYWNCFSFRSENEAVIHGKPPGWYESAPLGSGHSYNGRPQQGGRGAVALVFTREGVVTLLSSRHMAERPLDANQGWRRVDGGIVEAMNKEGWRELIHSPSLTFHTGAVSSMGNNPQKQALTFPGEDADALDFLSPVAAPPEAESWRREVEAVRRAIADDRERLAKAADARTRAHFQRLIHVYTHRLRDAEARLARAEGVQNAG